MILKRKTMLQKNKTKKTPFILTSRLLYFLEHFTPYLFWPLTSLFGTYFNLTFHYKTNFYQVP